MWNHETLVSGFKTTLKHTFIPCDSGLSFVTRSCQKKCPDMFEKCYYVKVGMLF